MNNGSLRPRIQKLAAAAGISLSAYHLTQLETYCRLLRRWNQTVNLTSLDLNGFPNATLDRLIREPLASARLIDGAIPICWFDLGSGGGSPAIPLKIVRPHAALTMVESRSRKGAFLREAVRVLGLADALVLSDRFEALDRTAFSGIADLVTVRAVRVDDVLARTVRMLLKADGRWILFSPSGPKAFHATGFQVAETLELPGGLASILVLRKGS